VWRAAWLCSELLCSIWLMGWLVPVSFVHWISWGLVATLSIAFARWHHAPQQLPVLELSALHLALAMLFVRLAYQDPVHQLRQALRNLRYGQLDAAHRAYGRYLRMGHAIPASRWPMLRRELGSSADARARFTGMHHACRYGDRLGQGESAYAALFADETAALVQASRTEDATP
jgi:hypothetical protein